MSRQVVDRVISGAGDCDATLVEKAVHRIGRATRNPLNFTERGFGQRGARGCVDRGHSAASQLKVGDFDFDELFSTNKVGWFDTGGIFAGLSEGTATLTLQACQAARNHGVKVSYDLNYRASLWQERGGFAAAQALNRRVVPHVDVILGALTEEQRIPAENSGNSEDIFATEAALAEKSIAAVREEFPHLEVAALTLRRVHTAYRNDWGRTAWIGGAFHRSRNYPHLDALDRIGSGDGFAAGLIYGLLNNVEPQRAIDLAAAHGALAMTTPGDTSMATLDEVLALADGGDARVTR